MPRPDVFRCDAARCWRACATGRPDEIAAGAPRGAVLPPGDRGRAALFLFLFASSPSSPNFSKCFSGDLLIEIFSEVSGQLQRRVRPPSPDRSPDRQRAPSRAFAPMAALREPALLNAWEGVRSCSQEMTVPPLCQTSRDHRRMMIVILRMIVPATGALERRRSRRAAASYLFAHGEIRLSAVAGRAGRFRHECTSRMRRDIR